MTLNSSTGVGWQQAVTFIVVAAVWSAGMCDVKAAVTFEHKLLAEDKAATDRFGRFVDLSGNVAIIGAYLDDDNGDASGSAYLFNVSTGDQLHKLLPDDGQADDNFGWTVSIDGNLALVGTSNGGAAYLFDVTTGGQMNKLIADDLDGDFGRQVALGGTTAVIGGGGRAWLYDVISGNELYELTTSDASFQFGDAVDISGQIAIVGDTFDEKAYLFDVTTGMQIGNALVGDDGGFLFPVTHFGHDVSIHGDRAIVGAYSELLEMPVARSGAAYVFDVNTGDRVAKLVPDDPQLNDLFGFSVTLDSGIAVVGAPRFSFPAGSVYLFDAETGQQLNKIDPFDAVVPDEFGNSVVLQGTTLIVGSPLNDSSGTAYVYDIPEPGVVWLWGVGVIGWLMRRRVIHSV